MPPLDSSRRGSIYRSSLICRPTSTRLSWQRTGTHPCRITLIPPSPAQLSLEHLRPSAHSWSLAPPTQRCTLCPQTVRRWRLNKEAVFWWSEALSFLARHTGAGSQTKKKRENSTKLSWTSRIACWCWILMRNIHPIVIPIPEYGLWRTYFVNGKSGISL